MMSRVAAGKNKMAKIGVCGLNCECCSRYQATRSGDSSELEKVKQFYIKLGLCEESLNADELVCHGCDPKNRCAYPEVVKCANDRGVETCGHCNSYPCEKINVVFAGKNTWLNEIKNRCTEEEYETLMRAFCEKKTNLDRIFEENRRAD